MCADTEARELAESQLAAPIAHRPRDKAAPFGNAGSAASLSFLLFALGAMVPLLPYGVLPAHSALLGSIGLSLAALRAIGARAAAVTYLAGRLFGSVIR